MPNTETTFATIIIGVKHNKLSVIRSAIGTSGIIDTLVCKFEFRSTDWAGIQKQAVFQSMNDYVQHKDDCKYFIDVNEQGECYVPSEVLTGQSEFLIGIFGMYEDGRRISSNMLAFKCDYGAYCIGATLCDTTSDDYEKIKELIDKKQDKLTAGQGIKIDDNNVISSSSTLTTGTANGTVSFNGEDVAVQGLGSAAYLDKDFFDSVFVGYSSPGIYNQVAQLYLDLNSNKLYFGYYDPGSGAGGGWHFHGNLFNGVNVDGNGNVITGAESIGSRLKLTKGLNAATSDELTAAESKIDTHIADKVNPHGVTAEQVGTYTKDTIDKKVFSATYDDTALRGKVTANETAIATLNGTSAVEGSVDKKVSDAINDFATKVSDDQIINTFKELIDYAADHKDEYSTLSGDVQKNTIAIANLNGTGVGSVTKTVNDAIEAANSNQKIEDLGQADYIIFDCGTSSTII